MRIDVKKQIFVGIEHERSLFFRRAQAAGIIQFVDSHSKPVAEVAASVQNIGHAIKVVQGLEVIEQEEVDDLTHGVKVASEILALKHTDEQLHEERRMLRQEEARVEVFGHFSLEDIDYLEQEGGRSVQFFCSKKGAAEETADNDGLFYVGSDHGLDYFLSVQPKRTRYESMIEMRLDRSLDSIHSRLAEIQTELTAVDDQLKGYAKYNDLLHKALVAEMNVHNLSATREFVETEVEDKVFAVTGWVPENRRSELEQLLEKCHVHSEEVAIEDDDHIPTYLENTGFSSVGEDLVHVYDTPATTDKDPSLWVLGSFAIFFAIILGDAGYGLIFLALAGFLWFKFPDAKGITRRIMKLTTLLSITCITWGVVTNSFFGVGFSIDHPTKALSVLDMMAESKAAYHLEQRDEVYAEWIKKFPAVHGMSDPSAVLRTASEEVDGRMQYPMLDKFRDNILLEFALFIGVLHVSIGLLRYIRRSPAGLGWILFLIGGYLYTPSYLNATSFLHFILGIDKAGAAEAGYHLLVVGICLAMLIAVVQDKLLGLLEIANLIQVFADVLSYLRLYALGLAGGIVSATVNEMAGSVAVVFGIVILILGHLVNIVLSLMGGVIHGLRLNFIEWYHYCFEGGGKMFQPLKLMKIE
ncbi:V-type ATP synthase subunit I [Chlamydiales bacterium SCGC AG-110-P3]|nr:V-type ATP synthase subunit I [Chlamydiales bacterium SCGC AG-110-P3]